MNVRLSFRKSKSYTIGRVILGLAALYVLIFVGIIKREFFSDYLWIALAVGALAMFALKAIMRITAPKND